VSDDYIETDESARVEMHATDITAEVAQKVGSLSPTQLGGLHPTGQKGSSVLAI
jgi:hypothetical protein